MLASDGVNERHWREGRLRFVFIVRQKLVKVALREAIWRSQPSRQEIYCSPRSLRFLFFGSVCVCNGEIAPKMKEEIASWKSTGYTVHRYTAGGLSGCVLKFVAW